MGKKHFVFNYLSTFSYRTIEHNGIIMCIVVDVDTVEVRRPQVHRVVPLDHIVCLLVWITEVMKTLTTW